MWVASVAKKKFMNGSSLSLELVANRKYGANQKAILAEIVFLKTLHSLRN